MDRPEARVEPSDVDLMARARRGDRQAFHVLVDRYAQYLFGVAVALVGSGPDAQDVVQEALLGAYRGVAKFAGRASVKTWLTQIVVRQAALHHRRAALRKTLPLEALESAGSADRDRAALTGEAQRTDARLDLHAALSRLSAEHREVLVLRELEGWSYEEIAAALQVPRGTVESRLFRARAALREVLGAP